MLVFIFVFSLTSCGAKRVSPEEETKIKNILSNTTKFEDEITYCTNYSYPTTIKKVGNTFEANVYLDDYRYVFKYDLAAKTVKKINFADKSETLFEENVEIATADEFSNYLSNKLTPANQKKVSYSINEIFPVVSKLFQNSKYIYVYENRYTFDVYVNVYGSAITDEKTKEIISLPESISFSAETQYSLLLTFDSKLEKLYPSLDVIIVGTRIRLFGYSIFTD